MSDKDELIASMERHGQWLERENKELRRLLDEAGPRRRCAKARECDPDAGTCECEKRRLSALAAQQPRQAKSKSEYRRLKEQGAEVLPPQHVYRPDGSDAPIRDSAQQPQPDKAADLMASMQSTLQQIADSVTKKKP